MAQRLKRLPEMPETWVQSLSWEDPLEKEMEAYPVFLLGESHGGRSLVGYSPQDRKASDTTERLHFLSFTFICLREEDHRDKMPFFPYLIKGAC